MTTTLHELLAAIQHELTHISETPALDAQVLLAHCLDKPRPWVMAHPEAQINQYEVQEILLQASRLTQGEPLPYILGHWEFYGMDFVVTPDVLIPRPETELLVERAISWLRLHPDARQAIDVGTGTGCIGIALAMSLPNLHVLLTDISAPALQVARRNIEKYGLSDRVQLEQADLLDGIGLAPDLLCANLPYIPRAILHGLPVFKKEPQLALDGGPDGLDLIQRLLEQARGHLAPGGVIFLEIEASQGAEVTRLARTLHPGANVQLRQDLSGRDRLVEISGSNLIFHLCTPADWLEAQKNGVYRSPSMDSVGFIHCCLPEQVNQVLKRYFQGVPEIIRLSIDPARLTSEIRWESADGELFPHVYGPINLQAVQSVNPLLPD